MSGNKLLESLKIKECDRFPSRVTGHYAFNNFPWGTFIYSRTFNSLSTCLLGRDDKFKNKFTDEKLEENVDAPVKRKAERYNVYGFVTAFQVWAIEAIPKWVTLGYATRVNNVTPRILNWQCTGIPTYSDIQKTIFKFKNITMYRTLSPTDEEARQPFWTSMDKLKYVLPDVDGCVGKDDAEDDVEDDAEDDVEDDVDDAMKDDIDGDHPTRTLKKVEFKGKKNRPITLEQVNKRLDVMQAQQNAMQAQQKAIQDQMTSMQNTIMDEMRMGFLRLTELICLNKVAEKFIEHNTTDFSHDDNNQDYQNSVPKGVKSPEFLILSETSEDVKQFTRPPKLTIRLPRDRKLSALTVSPYIDPTAKRPRKPKMPEFGCDSKVEDENVRSMQAWISDNKNTCMNTGLVEAKPAWFELLLSPNGWLEGDILFPANVNENHWVAVEVDLNERLIKVYDSKPDAYNVDQILKWATCIRKMVPSLLVHAMPDTYTDPSSFTVERPKEGVRLWGFHSQILGVPMGK
ncbi:hypothetical protein Ddye_022117 [Dipteronia dyeriana]|uniref:Ubiquitin-like protease family profile domain-containing protein n=1 Tax=Dipteronia dyeriana TaxID=168575 RepID=A0AAD9WYC3_9ROSI|nr:hypothetical protein Ddye_022117 [Dipteronia dyeriana]